MELIINPEFRDLVHPLSDTEFSQLEQNILADGIREPLCVWDGVLIDGHHRHKIAKKHDLPFKVKAMKFDNNDDVKLWMINNQLGKRNLTADQFSYFLGLKYIHEKKSHGGTGANQHSQSAHFGHSAKTAEKIAEEHGTSKNTVRRAGSLITKLLDENKENPEISDAFTARKITLSQARQMFAVPKEKRDAVVNKVLSGESKNVAQAKKVVEQEERIAKAPKEAKKEVVLLNGDCLDLIDSIDEKPNLVLTDPPYGIEVHNTRKGTSDYSDGLDYITSLLDSLCAKLVDKTSDDAHLYFFCGYSNIELFKTILRKYFDVQDNPIIWVKDNHTMCDFSKWYPNKHEYIVFAKKHGSDRTLEKCIPDVISCGRERSSTHSAEKPTELLKKLILQSTLEGEVVLDPFMGSGATGVAAVETKRGFIGFELSEDWYDVAKSRI